MDYAETGPVALETGQAGGKAKSARLARGERISIEQHGGTGLLWFAGWLFSIGFLHLGFWKGLLGLIIWPYYIGATVARLVQ